MGKTTEYKLSKTQQRMVLALVREREQIAAEAQAAIEEIGAAIDELAADFGDKACLPAEGGKRVFDQAGPGAPLVLRFVPEDQEKEADDEQSDSA